MNCRLFALALAAGALPMLFLDVAPAASAGDEAGWVQLFNGKDLTGWKTHEEDKAKWEVKDGVIESSGPVGHLYSERGDYENFHFRAEVKISNRGNSGQYFRTQFSRGFPPGYEAQINATGGDPIKTGSLYPAFDRKFRNRQAAQQAGILVLKSPHEPDEWFTQEIIAVGNHIIIKVNGKTTVDFVDENNTYKKGHFAFQQHDPGSRVSIRKVEVKELPASK